MIIALFWLCIGAATYSYFWYPLILMLAPARVNRRAGDPVSIQKIAIIIAARNEANKIAAKLDNTLALTPANVALDIVVASDASTDSTDTIVNAYFDKGVRLIRAPVRNGKEHAQELAINATDADLMIFTDTGTILPQDALVGLLEVFQDPTIGAVSSVDRFITADGSLQGEGAYVRYEMWLRGLESNFYSLVGLSGSFFAARRSVCELWDNRVQSDFGTALSCAQLGLRAVSDSHVIGYYKNIKDSRKEYMRKVRTVTRGINSLRIRAEVLNFTRYGRFSFEVFSHKIMRWATPWFLMAAFVTNINLAFHSVFYQVLLALQIAFYVSPLVAKLMPQVRQITGPRLAIYFIEVNVAIVHATFLALSGHTILAWEPSKR